MKKKQSIQIPDAESDQSDEIGFERIVFFSDAVFAIAVTLLALEIRQPESETLLEDSQLL